jgi:hypothetical protein
MDYLLVLMPVFAFVGVVAALVSMVRGRERSAGVWAGVGFGAILVAFGLYYLGS